MTSYPCPSCRTPANLTSGCPACGRGPDPDAAEVIRLDARIPVLTAQLAAAREAAAGADAELREAWRLREAAVARVRAALTVPPHPVPAPPVLRQPRTKEASTRLVQNVLFSLGGLLLAVAAIVFTAVAWSQFGVGGRALLLAGGTAAALAVPPLALGRGLTATGETFAAVGLLLVLLDGYAAWYVNVFGVADYSPLGYAGAVCAVTAAVAAGYEHATGLAGPRFAALLVAQPVLPLLVAPFHPDGAGWAYTLAAVAVLNLAVFRLRAAGPGALGVTAYLLGAGAASLSALAALSALGSTDAPGRVAAAAGALIFAALVPLAGAVPAGSPRAQSVTGGVLVVALAAGAGRLAGVVGGSFAAPVLIAAMITALAVLVHLVDLRLPARVRGGPWIGALLVTAVAGVVVLGVTIAVAAGGEGDWRLPAVIALLTVALTVLVSDPLRSSTVLGGAAVLAVAAPAGFAQPWWTAPGFDLLVVAAALAAALRASAPRGSALSGSVVGGSALWAASVALGLTVHAAAVASERPWVACATFATIAVLGAVAAIAGRSTAARLVGGMALAVGMLALPATAWSGAAALSLPGAVQSRAALAAAALLVGVLRLAGAGYRRFALAAALLGVVSAPAWAFATGDSPAIYAAVALLLVALSSRSVWAGVTALPLGATLLAGCAPSLSGVLLRPYGWLGEVGSGRPAGTGVGPVTVADVVALAVLAVAVGIAVHAASGRRAAAWAVAPVLAVLAPLTFAVAEVSWPGVPAASLIVGLALLLAVALPRPQAKAAGPVLACAALTGAALTGAGLAGALPTRGATLAALGLTLVVGAVAGVVGRTREARLAGWLTGATTTLAFAYTVGRAAALPLATTAFIVLGAAAALLAVGTALAGRPFAQGSAADGPAVGSRAVEGWTVQVAAHAGAFVAVLLTTGSVRRAAAVCTFWGLALGVRALRPGEVATVRRGHVLAAAVAVLGGWWLLVADAEVAAVEAYTLPAAGVALLAGWFARRSRDGLSSWVLYGPALAAALLPTLASVLAGDGQPVRRLLLGLGALTILLAGAQARLRAPVVAGGSVLAVVALHEVVLFWDLLPRWIPLAGAGLLLVGLAMTLERRRRELVRMRAALSRMG